MMHATNDACDRRRVLSFSFGLRQARVMAHYNLAVKVSDVVVINYLGFVNQDTSTRSIEIICAIHLRISAQELGSSIYYLLVTK